LLSQERETLSRGVDMSRRVGVALMVAVLALGGSLVAGEPAGAAEVHTVAVTPNTGLSDGQIVTLTGTGFDETPLVNDWAIAMCEPAILDAISLENALDHCDVTTEPFVFTPADEAGNIDTQYAVRRTFVVGGRTVTCGQSANDCAILVAQISSGGFVGAAAAISFGTPVKTVGECLHDFFHDHRHRLRFRLRHLLVCVITALHHQRDE
jgi:hypothetical protein